MTGRGAEIERPIRRLGGRGAGQLLLQLFLFLLAVGDRGDFHQAPGWPIFLRVAVRESVRSRMKSPGPSLWASDSRRFPSGLNTGAALIRSAAMQGLFIRTSRSTTGRDQPDD